MITKITKTVQLKMRGARFWPKMKFEPIFFRFFGSFCLAKRGDDFKFFFGGKFSQNQLVVILFKNSVLKLESKSCGC